MKKIVITLPKERPVSWNLFYSATHWQVRKDTANRVHDLVRYSLYELGYRTHHGDKIIREKVDIEVVAYLDRSPIDSDNICDKLYIDALKEYLLLDDNPKYVGRTSTRSEMDKVNPRVEIHITKSKF